MVNYLPSSFLFIITMVLALEPVVLGLNKSCSETRCGDHGPPVRFPFRIKSQQPLHCGYPGFDLSCTHRNDTLLQLPNSARLFVKKIDYKSLVVHASDPEGCFPRQLLNFTCDGVAPFGPFQFPPESLHNFTVYNCSPVQRDHLQYKIHCLGSLDYEVYAFSSSWSVDVELLSCTKRRDVLSIPSALIYSNGGILLLSWSDPAKCGFCEKRGKHCGFNHSGREYGLECYNVPKHKGAPAKVVATAPILALFLLLAFIGLYRKYSTDKGEKEYQRKIEDFLDDYKALNPTRFSFADIKRMTNEFRLVLGQGAYGTVYKGNVSNEIMVAVKLLNSSKGDGEEFVNEVETMGKIHHVNVVRLVGFCADGFRRALVYEYLTNESLEKFISSADAKNHFLGWKRLQDIALGIAKGIEYLHLGCDQRILHFDIKPHNILLDQSFNPKITDFGMAKLCAKDQSAVSMTTARGTIGYIAPEVFSRNFGNVSYKVDVYSFGMLLLEMVGGRKTVDGTSDNTDQIYFPVWIYNTLEEGGEDLRLDIEEEGDAKIAKKLAVVGLWCIQWNPADRPSMKMVVQMLEGDGDTLKAPPNAFNAAGPSKMDINKPSRSVRPKLAVISETE